MVARRETGGAYTAAVNAYLRQEVPQAERLNATLDAQTRAAQERFASHADDATHGVKLLRFAIPLLAVVIAALVLQGLAPRIREYR